MAGAELGGERLQPLGLQPGEGDARAAGGERAGGLLADPARGAGDEHGLAGELLAAHHLVSSWLFGPAWPARPGDLDHRAREAGLMAVMFTKPWIMPS